MSGRVKRAKFFDPLDVASVEQDWHQRGYSCQRFEDPPGQVWRDFVHSTNEVVMVSKGFEVEFDGEVFSRLREMKFSSHAIRRTLLPMRRTDEQFGFSVTADTAALYTVLTFDPDANNAFKYRN